MPNEPEDAVGYSPRGIAQSGSASGLGPEGREFKSLCPDHFSASPNQGLA